MDWNGDGKHDGKDDAFFHNVINKDNDNRGNGGGGEPPSNGGNGCSNVIFDIIALAYLSVLIPGDIPINTFTMLIGLICAGRLVYKFFCWLYS